MVRSGVVSKCVYGQCVDGGCEVGLQAVVRQACEVVRNQG